MGLSARIEAASMAVRLSAPLDIQGHAMRIEDQFVLALTLWRENRGGGLVGMQSVANVVVNRVAKHKTTAYLECLRPWQFSSMTAKGDAELNVWPADGDAQWLQAKDLAARASCGALDDITRGATLYYAPKGQTWTKRFTMPNGSEVAFPDKWDATRLQFAGEIAEQLFFREL